MQNEEKINCKQQLGRSISTNNSKKKKHNSIKNGTQINIFPKEDVMAHERSSTLLITRNAKQNIIEISLHTGQVGHHHKITNNMLGPNKRHDKLGDKTGFTGRLSLPRARTISTSWFGLSGETSRVIMTNIPETPAANKKMPAKPCDSPAASISPCQLIYYRPL